MKFSVPSVLSLTVFALQAEALNGYDSIDKELNIHDDSDLLSFESVSLSHVIATDPPCSTYTKRTAARSESASTECRLL